VKVALALLVVALLVVAWRLDILALFADPERMRDMLLAQGSTGYVIFVAAFAVFQALGIPQMAFVVGASYVWPKPIAFALSLAGALGASSLGFGFARYVARDWVAARIPPRFRRFDEKIAQRAFSTVFVVRLIFWGNPLWHLFFGISRLTFRDYIFATTVAYVPILAGGVWASGYAIDFLRAQPVSTWAPVAVAVVAAAIGFRVWRSRVRKREEAREEASDASRAIGD